MEGGQLVLRHTDLELASLEELLAQAHRPRRRNRTHDRTRVLVGETKDQPLPPNEPSAGRSLQGRASGSGVGAGEWPRAEFRPAEVPGHHNGCLHQRAAENRIQDRAATRPGRLPVVVEQLSAVQESSGQDVVRRVVIPAALLPLMLTGLTLRARPADDSDEARAPLPMLRFASPERQLDDIGSSL